MASISASSSKVPSRSTTPNLQGEKKKANVDAPAGDSFAVASSTPAAAPQAPTLQLAEPQAPVVGTRLKNKVAVITGASRGIGKAIAERFASEGALVAVTYNVNAEEATKTVSGIHSRGGKAFAMQVDIGSPEQIQNFYKHLDAELEKRTGTPKFDILVNNAAYDANATIRAITEEQIDRIFDVNVKGTFRMTKGAMDRFNNNGRLINVSSGAARVAYPASSAYSMTKAALNNMTLALAPELGARGITSNTLSPGTTRTDMLDTAMTPDLQAFFASKTALGRVGEPEDIAKAALALASDDGSWITAQVVEASGGICIQ